jgi:hypothetical protein
MPRAPPAITNANARGGSLEEISQTAERRAAVAEQVRAAAPLPATAPLTAAAPD